MISIIVAVDQNMVMAKNGEIPWDCPDDMKYFKEKTLDKPIIMGAKTFKSIGKCLPRRLNIVLDVNFKKKNNPRHVDKSNNVYFVSNNLRETIEISHSFLGDCCEIMVCGGRSVYNSFIKGGLVDRFYINTIKTEVKREDEDDILYFPFPLGKKLISEKDHGDFVARIYG